MNREDIVGQVFGRLSVLRYYPNLKSQYNACRYECKCTCGKVIITLRHSLLNGRTKSCGCLRKELSSLHAEYLNKLFKSEYNSWSNMKSRCYDINRPDFIYYGARGIKVVKPWHSFKKFLEDMGAKPDIKSTLDRVNVNGDYCKENCRWASWKTQQNNRRNNRYITIQNKKLTVTEWSETMNLDIRTVIKRYGSGL